VFSNEVSLATNYNSERLRGSLGLIIATVATGVLSGAGAVGFHFIADRFGEMWFAWGASQEAQELMIRLPAVLVLPTIGLGLVGIILQLFPDTRRGGVVEVMDALKDAGGLIPFRRIFNVILSGLVLAFGGSVGPEGPMVQLGALVGSVVGQRSHLMAGSLPVIVRAGAAAGIAAAFRSPAGGVLLIVELFGVRFNQELAVVGIAAVLGYLTRTAWLGDVYPFLPPTPLETLPLSGLLFVVPVIGLLAAPAGHQFISMFNRFKTVFPTEWPLALRVALGGLLIGVIGIWFPQVLSAGYPVIEDGLRGGLALQLFVILFFLKMLATSITFGSGAVGGLFAPTLVIGAMYGGAFGYGFRYIVPSAVPQPELFVLLGMVVMFGSIVKGYWSGLLLVADMSGAYHQLLLPGVIAGGISFVLSWKLHDRSIFGLRLDPTREPEREQEAQLV